ncbi:hypothetical protein JA1_004167 [Spathaspora sp. JA1]|nr:hypothetical protein JA1_004167 [Spathaspora sp. JA1]
MTNKIKQSKTDVLIIGAGPAGLMCATWLARCGIPFRIIDKKEQKIFSGQADGLQSRSLEIFKSFSETSFDFTTLDTAWKIANHIHGMCSWTPNKQGELVRNCRVPESSSGISRYSQCVLHQGYIEHFFIVTIRNFSSGEVEVERPRVPVSININEAEAKNQDAYAVEVIIKTLDKEDLNNDDQFGSKLADNSYEQFDNKLNFKSKLENDPNINIQEYEIINAKYVLGADGAHSWVRDQLDIEMDGEKTDFVWGVLDMVPITNFPDIRSNCAIHSKDSGSIMIIPRENQLVRLYIQLNKVERDPNNKTVTRNGNAKKGDSQVGFDRSEVTAELILKQAQEIMKPYTLEMTDLDWFSGYQIGEGLSQNFHRHNRVFISGDACHTHSPMGGQGMNVSMQDTYNLGFKLALVCKGLARQEILETYEPERLKVARDLIDFDTKLSRLFSYKPQIPDANQQDGADMNEFHKVYQNGSKFASGTIVDYGDSILIKKKGSKEPGSGCCMNPLASHIPIGRRLHSVIMISQADAGPIHIADRLVSDGRFRVLIFPGDVNEHGGNMETLYKFQPLLDDKDFFAKKFTPVNALSDSVIDLIIIHGSSRENVEFYDFPEFARPRDYKGRCNYWKLYSGLSDTREIKVDIYESYGIDKNKGAIIVTRPDTHVALVTDFSISGLKEVDQYFKEFMLPQNKVILPKGSTREYKQKFVRPRLGM